jgi:hypothetical protein
MRMQAKVISAIVGLVGLVVLAGIQVSNLDGSIAATQVAVDDAVASVAKADAEVKRNAALPDHGGKCGSVSCEAYSKDRLATARTAEVDTRRFLDERIGRRRLWLFGTIALGVLAVAFLVFMIRVGRRRAS